MMIHSPRPVSLPNIGKLHGVHFSRTLFGEISGREGGDAL